MTATRCQALSADDYLLYLKQERDDYRAMLIKIARGHEDNGKPLSGGVARAEARNILWKYKRDWSKRGRTDNG